MKTGYFLHVSRTIASKCVRIILIDIHISELGRGARASCSGFFSLPEKGRKWGFCYSPVFERGL